MEEELRDLADRWRRARCAALRSITGADGAEDDLLAAVLERDPELGARRVFDNGLRLGAGFARHHRRPLAMSDIPAALRALGVPCLAGEVREADGGAALYLERAGCPAAGSAELCDHWREAISGLFLGATDGIRHTRHESRGHGGRRCVDLFYADPESPLRFGPIPDELRPALARAARIARAFDSTAEVRFLGLSEGVVLYEVRRDGCDGGIDIHSQLERAVRRDHPELALRETSARPVFRD